MLLRVGWTMPGTLHFGMGSQQFVTCESGHRDTTFLKKEFYRMEPRLNYSLVTLRSNVISRKCVCFFL